MIEQPAPVSVTIGGDVLAVPPITNFYRYKRCGEAVKAIRAEYARCCDPETGKVDAGRLDQDKLATLCFVVVSAALFETRPELTPVDLEKRASRQEALDLMTPVTEILAPNFRSAAPGEEQPATKPASPKT